MEAILATIANVLQEIKNFGLITAIMPEAKLVPAVIVLGEIAKQVARDNGALPEDVHLLNMDVVLSPQAQWLLEEYRHIQQGILTT